MRVKRMFFYLFCMTAVVMSSCSDDDDAVSPTPEETENQPNTEMPEDSGDPEDELLNPNSQNVSYENAIVIVFSDTEVMIDNPFEDSGVAIVENEGHVTVTSTIEGTELNYVVSGITADGSLKIYGNYKFGLVLNGTGITNPNGAAINIQCGKKVTVTVVDNTNNRLVDGETYTYVDGEDMKATFFSEGQLNFYGKGTLEVRGKNKHAICTDDYFRVYEGNIWVKEAASDAIHANDYIRIDGGTITTRSNGDGFDSEGYIEINSGDIEIVTLGEKGHGMKSSDYTTISSDGTIVVTVYGNASKGIKPKGDMIITKGDITINTSGDAIWEADEQDTSSSAGIKSDANMVFDNATLTLLSTGKGGKGINIDGTLTINSGTITVTTTGDQYVYDRNNDTAAKAIKSDGDLTVNGGTIKIRTSKTEAEGLESKATLTITGGDVDIEAYDDCINASNHIQIDGGSVYCSSVTNDAIDSNGTLTITGGTVVVAGSSSPEGGIDCDNSRFTITGGTIVGIGGDTSTPTANYCTQRSVIYNATASNVEIIRIESTSGGNEVLTFKMPKTYSSRMTMLFSSPLLEANTGYTIYTGGSISGGENFHGLYTGASYNKGTSAATFTTGSAAGAVSTVGSNNQRPGGGGF